MNEQAMSKLVIVGRDLQVARRVLDELPAATSSDGLMTLQTKYYTAHIKYQCLTMTDVLQHSLPEDLEGIIFAFNADDSTGLTCMHKCAIIDDCQLRVYIAFCKDTATHEDEVIARCLKCLEAGFEYIEVFPSAQQQPALSTDSREATGIARLMESLESTMWRSMCQKTNSPDPAPKSYIMHEGSSGSLENQKGKRQAPQIPPDSTVNATSMQLEELLAEAAELKRRSSHIRDEQRRDRASELALRFAQMIGLNEVATEDEE